MSRRGALIAFPIVTLHHEPPRPPEYGGCHSSARVTIFGREGTGDRGNPLIFQAVEDGLCLAAFSLGGGWPPPVDHMPSAKTRRPFILVIDDEPLVAAVIADTLMLVGYEVETAKNGREALEKIAACSYDLILSDLRMPELDGPSLYEALRTRSRTTLPRVIFMTGNAADYAEFLKGTTEPILEKPFNLKVVQQVVRVLLKRLRSAVDHPSDAPIQDECEIAPPVLTPLPARSSGGPAAS